MQTEQEAKFDELKEAMLSFLPEDGTPVLNRVMRVMLARNLERSVDEDTFFKARDALLNKGLVGRLRGQGGQLFLAKETRPPDPQPSVSVQEPWPESRLMEPLRLFL